MAPVLHEASGHLIVHKGIVEAIGVVDQILSQDLGSGDLLARINTPACLDVSHACHICITRMYTPVPNGMQMHTRHVILCIFT